MKLSKFNWGPGLFLIGYHLFLLIAIPLFLINQMPSGTLIAISAILMYVSGICVTAGYHRLYSHLTYKINPVAETVLLFFATMSAQGSAIRWSFDHRHHHAYVDTDRDPYSINKGFWYAHFMWLFEKPKPIDNKVVADLVKKPLLRFQHRFYPYLFFGTNIIATAVIGWVIGDYWAAFLFGWLLRMFVLHHFTWFINSLAHTWGVRPFCSELSAVDNYAISLLTFGEGYHNYHHTFAYDYRNGVRWFHFDPTKWLIWTLSKLGLAHQLKKNNHYFIEEKVFLERKQILLDKLKASLSTCKEELESKITDLSDNLVEKIKQVRKLCEDYRMLKEKKEGKSEYLKEMHEQIKTAKKALKKECRDWMEFAQRVATDVDSQMLAD